jgi:hypothetical protein
MNKLEMYQNVFESKGGLQANALPKTLKQDKNFIEIGVRGAIPVSKSEY